MQRLFAIALGLSSGMASFAITAGFTHSRLAGWLIAVIAVVGVTIAVWRRPPIVLADEAAPRALKWVAALATIVALIQLGRLTVFMVDPTEVAYSSFPSSSFELRHSCLTAYFCAAEAVDTQPNVYDPLLYALPGNADAPREAKMLGPFRVDQFEYPPTFLLLPRLLSSRHERFLAVPLALVWSQSAGDRWGNALGRKSARRSCSDAGGTSAATRLCRDADDEHAAEGQHPRHGHRSVGSGDAVF